MDMAVSLPVRGFSVGTLVISTLSVPNSPATSMVWQFIFRPGTARMRIMVRSGPNPAMDTVADTLTLAGKPLQASRTDP